MKPRSISTHTVSRATLLATNLGLAVASHAADQTWIDTNENNDWNTTSAAVAQSNWDEGVAWTQGNNAIFGGTGETVTLTEGIDAGNLTFNAPGYTLSGSPMTLVGSPSLITTGSGNDATIGSVLAAGGSGMTKAGTGTLTLTSANTYSGSTLVNGGTLKLNPPVVAPAVLSQSLVRLDASDAANLTVAAGKVTSWADLSGNDYDVANATSTAVPYTDGNGRKWVKFDGTANARLSNSSWTASGANFSTAKSTMFVVWGLNGTQNKYVVARTSGFNDEHWRYDGNGNSYFCQFGAGPGRINTPMPTTGNHITTFTMDGNLSAWKDADPSGTPSVTGSVGSFSANGDLIIGGGAQFSSDLNGHVGEVLIFNTVLTPTERQQVYQYLNYKWFGAGAANILPSATPLDIAGGATLDLNGSIQQVGSLSGSGTLTNSSSTPATLTFGDGSSTAFSGTITNSAGALNLTKAGSGTATLSGVNTYTGATTINAGTLAIGGSGQLGGGIHAGTIVDNGILNYSSSANQTFSGVISGTGSLLKDTGTSTLTLSGVNTYTGGSTVNAGTLKLDLSARSGALSVTSVYTVGSSGTLELLSGSNTNADSTLFQNTTYQGTGVIRKSGDGYLGLMHANTSINGFDGTFDVQTGTLGFNNGIVGSGKATLNIANSAKVDIRTGTLKVDALTSSGDNTGNVYVSHTTGGTLSLGNNNGSGTFAGTLTNGGSALTVIKNGSGTQTLSGTNTYTGTTTVNAGTLKVDGSLGASSTVTVKNTATLGGSGTFNGAINVESGGTLAAAGTCVGNVSIPSGAFLKPSGSGSTGTLVAQGTLTIGGNLSIDVQKAGDTVTSDQVESNNTVNLNSGSSITLNVIGETLEAGDTVTVFTGSPTLVGTSVNITTVPALLDGMSWDQSQLLVNGTLTLVDRPATPIFSPAGGGYVGTPSVTVTSDSGSTIYYTVNGSEPTLASPNGPSPLTLGNLPANTTGYTVKAIALKASSQSQTATAVYNTLNTAQWNVDNNGDWSDSTKWLNSVIPDGVDAAADFSFDQSADSTVTLDSNRSVGSLHFGNLNDIAWTINSSNSSVLTLATSAGAPSIAVDADRSATIAAPVTSTQGLTKTGAGALALANANTYTGATTVSSGSLAYTGPQFVSFATSALQVDGGTTAEFRTLADAVVSAPITGSGTVLASGNGTSLRLGGANGSFSGTFATSNNGSIDFVNVSQGWSSNASYLLNGSYMRIYGSSVGQTIGIGSLAGSNANTEISNWGGSAVTTTLSIGALNTDTEYAGSIRDKYQDFYSPGTMAVTKVGSGKLTLSGSCNYSGATNVTAGTLEVNGSLAAGSAVSVSSGATLTGSGTVNGAVNVQDGATIAPGDDGAGTLTAGSATLSGAYPCQLDGASGDHLNVTGALTISPTASITVSTLSAPTESSYTILSYTAPLVGSLPTITGVPEGYEVDTSTPGVVKLVNGTPFDSWINGFESLTNPADKTPTADPDQDGLANILEFVLNGDPTSGASTNLPTITNSGSDIVFTFTRRDDSESFNPTVEFDADLAGTWTTAVNGTNCTIVVTENDANPDTVTVTIPKQANTKLFARLKVNP